MKAQGNHNLDEILRLLSKEVDFRTFVKLKALTNASDSEFLNSQLFEFFRKRQGDIPFTDVLSLPSEVADPLKSRLLNWLVRWRRLIEPWQGEELHSAIGEIKWGLSRGMGEDLAEYIVEAMQIAEGLGNFPAMLEILGMERQVVMTYWETGDRRIKRLEAIKVLRENLILAIRSQDETYMRGAVWRIDPKDISHRVKSDLLYRLCHSLTDEECDELRRHIHLHRKDAKQLRLLEYYRQMAEWSREQEKKDWAGENLAQLKSNTLAWLMRNMARYGNWHGRELHHLLGDLQWANAKGIEAHLEGLFLRAYSMSVEMESYELAADLIAIGRKFYPGVNIADWETLVFAQLEEIERVHALRLEYFESIRIRNKINGINHIDAWRTFGEILSDSKWEMISTSNAKRELTKFRIMAYISLSENNRGGEAARELLTLHKCRPFIAESNFLCYLEELRLCCLALVLDCRYDEALELVDQMGRLEITTKSIAPYTVLHRLLALSYIYDATTNPDLAELALELFETGRVNIKKSDDVQKRIWLLSFVAKAALDLGRFTQAKEALNEILDQKVQASTTLVAHSRVRLLLALLGCMVESEVISHAATACLVYLKRNANAPKYLQQVVLLVKRISQYESGSIEQAMALEKASFDAEDIFNEELRGQGFNLNYAQIFRKIGARIT